jgi:hypothetical protein
MAAKGTFLFGATKDQTLVTIVKRKETQIAGNSLIEVQATDQILHRTGWADLRNRLRNLLI